jgi:ABC-type branched-chain amino acid transport systems, periplasmic component
MRWKLIGAALIFAVATTGANAQEPIRIGEINSYKAFPSALGPYRLGWQLAVDEINASGGVLGRKIEVISRDDNGNPSDAVRVAEELVSREGISLLVGTFASHVALAVSDFARQRKVLLIAAQTFSEKVVWSQGHEYAFSVRPNTQVQTAMLAAEAIKIKAKRWAVIFPDYEFGQTAAASFKKEILAKHPDATFTDFPVPFGKADGGALVQAVTENKPDAIFSALFASDLIRLAREVAVRKAFNDMPVFNLLAGEPEYLDSLKDDVPVGWTVTGYPWNEIKTPEHERFLAMYRARYNDYPRVGSVAGYLAFHAVAEAIKKAGAADKDKVITAFEGLTVSSPFGRVTFRKVDHASTMGTFVGRLGRRDNAPAMVDWHYVDATRFLPNEAEALALRPKR